MKAYKTEIRDYQITTIAELLNEFKTYHIVVAFTKLMFEDTIKFFESLGYDVKLEKSEPNRYEYRISRATPQ